MSNIQDIFSNEGLPGMNGDSIPVYEPLELIEVKNNPNNRAPDLEEDYCTVRKTLHFQNQMLMDAAKIFLESAKNSDSPRHMEVFSTLMNQVTTSNKELLKIHKEMKEITNESTNTKNGQAGNMNINNAQVFVGSTSEFMDSIENEQYKINQL